MKITRKWAMPNSNTFSINSIAELIARHIDGVSVDPFANSNRLATITNDINPEYGCDYTLDALVFLRTIDESSVDTVLSDPPYSPRQVSECYKAMDETVNMQTTQSAFWGNLKKEVSRITKPSGKVITCGWNSGGIGKKYSFDIIEILLVPHGGWHNDTIITVQLTKNRIHFLNKNKAKGEVMIKYIGVWGGLFGAAINIPSMMQGSGMNICVFIFCCATATLSFFIARS